MSYHSIIKMFKNQCDAGHPRLALHTLSEETNTIQSSVKETARNSENCTKKKKYEWRKQQRCDTTEELKAKVTISACTN